jgi:hypothetical protein
MFTVVAPSPTLRAAPSKWHNSRDMRRFVPILLVVLAFFLHQDVWYWQAATPLVFGVLPPGLWYHALYALGCAGLMWYLTRAVWPTHLDRD